MDKLKYAWIVIFIAGLLLRTINLFHPIDTDSWRESDVESIAKNYYYNGMNFAYPQVAWGGKGPGYAEMEFPLYPYLIALTYKIFGVHDAIGRVWSFMFSLGTLLLFFKLSRLIFSNSTALISSIIFTFNPLLIYVSNAIQPESVMFFFYTGSVLFFLKWMENQSLKNSLLLFIFTTFTLLGKITSIHLGILFLLVIIFSKNWRFLYNSKIIIIAISSLILPIAWYWHAHNLFLQYGNSLGLSNEYHWVGWDFFTNSYFIKGVTKQEIEDVWMLPGILVIIIAIIAGNVFQNPGFKIGFFWMMAVSFFYFIATRTTADEWAFYYHIFSVPVAAIMIASSIESLLRKLNFQPDKWKYLFSGKGTFLVLSLALLFILTQSFSYTKTFKRLSYNYRASVYHMSAQNITQLIPKGSLILANGGPCADDTGHRRAYNSSYFFFWLDCKGYNICIQDQSVDSVQTYKRIGVRYFIAEKRAISYAEGFEKNLRNSFKILYEDDYILLFKL